MSDPRYGDHFVHIYKPKECCRYVLCRPSKRNTRSRTRGNNVHTLRIELLYNSSSKYPVGIHWEELVLFILDSILYNYFNGRNAYIFFLKETSGNNASNYRP